ncbi:MAG TPA: hypothetical protein VMV92_09325 [Streptosporangiaceae bacterium]|nr:hypothetical protein [Streptosporangiaceae bacterium]
MTDRNTSRLKAPRRRRVSELPTMVESADGWYGFGLRGIGWVEVAMAKVDGSPEIVGLRIDVRPMFVDESELHVLDMTAEQQRQWAIDNGPHGAAPAAVITAERLRSLPLAELRAAVAARMAGDDAFGAFEKVARERGKAWPDEHYRQVAEVYKSAVEHRKPPLKAIQEHWHVTRPAAAKYVKGARERGFLGWPERAGVAGYDATESPFTK